MLKVISPDLIPAMWREVEPWLSSALEYSQGDYTIDHVQVYLSSGQWMLLVSYANNSINGAAAISFFNRAAKRIAFIIAAGGKFVSDNDTFLQLQSICKQYYATHIEGAVRESTARLWARHGFTEKYRIIGATL